MNLNIQFNVFVLHSSEYRILYLCFTQHPSFFFGSATATVFVSKVQGPGVGHKPQLMFEWGFPCSQLSCNILNTLQ